MTQEESTPLFFPHGTLCSSCGYEIGTTYIDLCPECGSPLETLAAVGRIVECTEQHRDAFPASIYPRPDRYIHPFLKQKTRDIFTIFPIIALVLWTLITAVLVRRDSELVYSPQGYVVLSLVALLASIPIVLTSVVIQGEFRAWRIRRAIAKNTLSDLIEQYHCTITRALILNHDSTQWLVINTTWRGSSRIYCFPPHEIRRLQIDMKHPIGFDAKLDIHAASNTLVRITTSGPPVPTRTSTQLKPRFVVRPLRVLITADQEYVIFGGRRSKGSYFTTDS